jgi:hypothetical protein
MRSSGSPPDQADGFALALGPASALLVAAALSGVRTEFGATNVALVMACLVVAAAIAGRRAGLATAVVAAVSYNFFHTQPYQSLRIDDIKDWCTVALLAALGAVVSEVSYRRRRATVQSKLHLRGEHVLERAAASVASGAPADAVWTEIESSLVEVLELAECRFERGAVTTMSVLPRSASLVDREMHWERAGFELPPTGVAVQVACGGRVFGHIVLVPSPHAGSSREARRVAVALADQFAVALALADAASAPASVIGDVDRP